MEQVLTWDGTEFEHRDRDEAEKLEKADKLQILSDGLVSGLELKYTHEFTGYKTREMRAAPAPKPKASEPKPPPPETESTDYESMKVPELRAEATRRDLAHSGLRKDELIDLLKQDDE